MRQGIVHVWEIERDYFLTGRFGAIWERGEGGYARLDDADFEEALDWARSRAEVVVVSFGSGPRYNAGERPDPEYPLLPQGLGPFVYRRDPEYAYFDRSENDPPIEWQASLSFTLEGEPLGPFAQRFVDEVRARLHSAQGIGDPASSRVEVGVVITAPTWAEAQRMADRALLEAIDAAGPAGTTETMCAVYTGVGNLRPRCD